MRVRRGLTRVAVLALFGALLGLVPLPLAQASCIGPVIGVGDHVDDARPPETGLLPMAGADVIVSGVYFRTGCEDSSQAGGCAVPVDSEAPMRDVDLVLEQGGSSWVLGTQSASSREESYAITWAVQVPADAQPGPATLRAGDDELRVEISAGP